MGNRRPLTVSITASAMLSFLLQLIGIGIVLVLAFQLRALISLCLLSVLLAIALHPILNRLRRYLPRLIALPLMLFTLFGVIACLIVLIVPPLVAETHRLIENLPKWL